MPNGARARPSKANLRPDHNGTQQRQFESNKKKIYATQKVCGNIDTSNSALYGLGICW